MPVLLTSFKASRHLDVMYDATWTIQGVARWSPKDFRGESLRFLVPVDERGDMIYTDGSYSQAAIDKYRADYFEALKSRKPAVRQWLSELDPEQNLALACWCCPQQGKGKVWFQRTGRFMCHTMLIGQLIRKYRPDIEVEPDADREAYSVFGL